MNYRHSSSCPLPAGYPHTSGFYALFNQSNNALCCLPINPVEVLPDKFFSVPCQTGIVTQELLYSRLDIFRPVDPACNTLLNIIYDIGLAT